MPVDSEVNNMQFSIEGEITQQGKEQVVNFFVVFRKDLTEGKFC